MTRDARGHPLHLPVPMTRDDQALLRLPDRLQGPEFHLIAHNLPQKTFVTKRGLKLWTKLTPVLDHLGLP
jgi:hypothetical protein